MSTCYCRPQTLFEGPSCIGPAACYCYGDWNWEKQKCVQGRKSRHKRGRGGGEYIVYWFYWHCLCYWTIYICCSLYPGGSRGSLLIYDCWRKSGLKAGGKLLFINKYATHKSLCWAINKPHGTRLEQAGATNVIKCVSSWGGRERKGKASERKVKVKVNRKVFCHVASCVYWPHWHFGACLPPFAVAVARLTLIR